MSTSFNFMRFRNFYFLFSLCFLIPGIISLVLFGLRPAIDFTGGSLLELRTEQAETPSREQVQEAAGEIYQVSSVQNSGAGQFIIRGVSISNDQKLELENKLSTTLGPLNEVRFETVGPTLGRELLQKTVFAIILASVGITFYVARQFRSFKYGVCAILAMFHDTFILLGAFSLLGKFFNIEVDVLFVTALLTTLSFSVHDTIVVFDRIRETLRRNARFSFKEVANTAVLETLGRSMNNSMTIIIMLLSLVLLGGETIRWFALALLIGAVTGTYSSTFTAVPLLTVWDDLAQWWRNRKR